MADSILLLPPSPSDESEHDNIPTISRSASSTPPPYLSPSLALSACPPLVRSLSTASSAASSVSELESSSSRLSAVDGAPAHVNARRGYRRPQATHLAESAKNRESVMSLGSIAHLQYYFARTGLLDGKGAQPAPARNRLVSNNLLLAPDPTTGSRRVSSAPARVDCRDNRNTLYFDSSIESLRLFTAAAATADGGMGDETYKSNAPVDSPIELDEESDWTEESPAMLPPTVSTYKHRPVYVPPPPDVKTLRKELLRAVEDACKVLEELHQNKTPSAPGTPQKDKKKTGSATDTPTAMGEHVERQDTPTAKAEGVERQDTSAAKAEDVEKQDTGVKAQNGAPGWHEIQGVHLLDVTTLAIRAAKNYYTAHERPQRLYSIKTERAIRSELFQVLEVLKRMAARNFAGGIRSSEQNAILLWIVGISDLLKTEEDMERAEQDEREKWRWRTGDWTGREREREWLFLNSLLPTDQDQLPEWTELPSEDACGEKEGDGGELPSPFLARLRTGVVLIQAHNAAVRASKRQFEEITKVHTDTTKPYRCAENLRFFIKAAERRWDVKLQVDVLSIVTDDRRKEARDGAWRAFDAALRAWCKGVREEIVRDWEQKEKERAQTSGKGADESECSSSS